MTEASLPTIDVGSPGRVAIAYVGSTKAPGGPHPTGTGAAYDQATWSGYMTITTTALESDPIFLTTMVGSSVRASDRQLHQVLAAARGHVDFVGERAACTRAVAVAAQASGIEHLRGRFFP